MPRSSRTTTSRYQAIYARREHIRVMSRSSRAKMLLFIGLAIIILGASAAFALARGLFQAPAATVSMASAPIQTAMFGFDAQHTHDNPAEQTLTYANVA